MMQRLRLSVWDFSIVWCVGLWVRDLGIRVWGVHKMRVPRFGPPRVWPKTQTPRKANNKFYRPKAPPLTGSCQGFFVKGLTIRATIRATLIIRKTLGVVYSHFTGLQRGVLS